MKQTEQLEQLKKEYQEIPVPEHGIDGVKAAMERAGQKKRLKKRLVGYASMAAAAALVLFVAPEMGMRMFAAGGAAPEFANKAQDSMMKDMINGGINADGEAIEEPLYPTKTPDAYLYGETVPGWSPESAESGKADTSSSVESFDEQFLFNEAVREKISLEIIRQMEESVASGEETFLADEVRSGSFACISRDQEYYINDDSLLVIVFAPGEIAPAVYGEIEFIIPNEVWK